MGSNGDFLLLAFVCMLIGSFAIIGFPFLAGFYSKDLILEFTFGRYIVDGFFIYNLAIVSAFFTAVYSLKLLIYTFYITSPSFRAYLLGLSQSEILMFAVLISLAILALFVGYFVSDLMAGWGSFY